MTLNCRIVLSILFSVFVLFAYGQTGPVKLLINHVNDIRRQLPAEQLYLQLDKPGYFQGDTIWFKAYLFDADYLLPSARSRLLYVELDDINNNAVKRILAPLYSGLSWGNIELDAGIPEGNYTLRAYTNWMRNFGEDYVFKKSLYIAPTGGQAHLVAASFKASKQAGKDNIRANILISNLDEKPERLTDMELKVVDGRRTLLKSKATTGIDGKLDVNFDLPANVAIKDLSIIAQDVTKGTEKASPLTIPVLLNRPEYTDLQFMPEGGALVAGIRAKIGFKAIGEDGKGEDVSGMIYDSKQQEVSSFKSAHNGMGSFELVPLAGQSYTAKLNLPGGSASYPLPAVSSSGTCLRAGNYIGDDTLKLGISVTAGLLAPNTAYYLVGQSRGVVCYAAMLSPAKPELTVPVPKSQFPTGIARFTLLNAGYQPLNERICFINHHDNLQINVETDKTAYAAHDSIALRLCVTDKSGLPVRGSFSLAVTDDKQVKADSTDSNIENDLLLTSGLKGIVEAPGYYFENDSPQRLADLDNLMLTQGWVGYDWKQVTNPNIQPLYIAEQDFKVQGTVLNAFNKPVGGAGVVLLSKKPDFVKDTITGKDGRFIFRGFSPVDTAAYFIQAKNRHGKSFNVGITVDEFKPPVFAPNTQRIIPWYVNSDALLMNSLSARQAKQQAGLKLMGPNILKEVIIKAKKVVKDSKNLNGPGESDEVLDEKDMEKAGKMTLYQVLLKLDGFIDNLQRFTIHGEPVILIIDGVNVNNFFVPLPPPATPLMVRIAYHNFLKSYMDYFTAEDIKGIEGMYNYTKYLKYDFQFYSELTIRNGPPAFAFLEITTRSGNGAFFKATPGVYMYKPLAFSLPKQFYRPKYTPANRQVLLPDLRSTIHWEPNIITDSAGKAALSFYSADRPTSYTVIIEGTDLNGRIGFARKKVVVK